MRKLKQRENSHKAQRKSRNARKFGLIDMDDLEEDTFEESDCSEEEYIEVERRNNCSLNDIQIRQKTKGKVKTKTKMNRSIDMVIEEING